MWNDRFSAPSGDPFDNSQGFLFPAPEGAARFPAFDPIVTHLLIAQANIPPTEMVEVARLTGPAPRFERLSQRANPAGRAGSAEWVGELPGAVRRTLS